MQPIDAVAPVEQPAADRDDLGPAGGRIARTVTSAGPATSTLTVPAMMSAFSLSTSALSPASTLLSNSWYGASETPLFSSVPR